MRTDAASGGPHSWAATPSGTPRDTTPVNAPPMQGWRPWGIGGSDIGAILGVSPYRGPVDVWLDKVWRDGGEQDAGALPMRLRSYLEPFVVQEYEALPGNTTRQHAATLRHPEHPELFGHVDRLATQTHPTQGTLDVVLECKTCSAFRAHE